MKKPSRYQSILWDMDLKSIPTLISVPVVRAAGQPVHAAVNATSLNKNKKSNTRWCCFFLMEEVFIWYTQGPARVWTGASDPTGLSRQNIASVANHHLRVYISWMPAVFERLNIQPLKPEGIFNCRLSMLPFDLAQGGESFDFAQDRELANGWSNRFLLRSLN